MCIYIYIYDHLAVLNAGDGCGEDVSCSTGVPEAELHLSAVNRSLYTYIYIYMFVCLFIYTETEI